VIGDVADSSGLVGLGGGGVDPTLIVGGSGEGALIGLAPPRGVGVDGMLLWDAV
jgi:hypothetical protein